MKRSLYWSVLAALCASSGAHALPEDTVRPWLASSVSHNSNYFLAANDEQALALIGSTDTAVTIYRNGVGVDADLKLGRQSLALRGNYYAVNFDRDFLQPTTEWRVQADWNWVLGNRLSGSLNYHIEEAIQTQADAISTVQNKQQQQATGFSGSYQIHPSFYVDIGLGKADYTYTPVARNVLDRNETTRKLGWRMPTSSGNFLGMEYRRNDGEYPNRIPAQTFRQTDLNLNGNWSPSGASRISWSAGQTRREEGATKTQQPSWSLSGNWTPSGKLRLNANWNKSVGSSETSTASNTTVTTQSALGTSWLATSKLTLNGSVHSQRVQYEGAGRIDEIEGGGLNLNYQALHSVHFTLGVNREQRKSNVESANYRADIWNAGLRISF